MIELEALVSELANTLLAGRPRIALLEAGCGSATHIRFQAEVHAVGIDISAQQLERNSALNEKILGDIQSHPLPPEEFDVVICWMVLEHLPRPEDALRNMFRAVKPSGILILGIPNLFSLKGLITKFTPFWFHTAFYRFMRYTNRPFPTYCHLAILPNRIMRLAEANGFVTEMCSLVQGGVMQRVRQRFWAADIAVRMIAGASRTVSRDSMPSILLDKCGLVFRKQAA